MTKSKSLCKVLNIRKLLGKVVTLVGISVGLFTLTGCGDKEMLDAVPTPVTAGQTSKIFSDPIQQMPMFPGGQQALMNYLAENVHYTDEMAEICAQGRVIVTFIVEIDGSITEAKVVKSVHPLLDEEALRVVKAMPKWTPGSIDGKLMRNRYTMPVIFRPDEKR